MQWLGTKDTKRTREHANQVCFGGLICRRNLDFAGAGAALGAGADRVYSSQIYPVLMSAALESRERTGWRRAQT